MANKSKIIFAVLIVSILILNVVLIAMSIPTGQKAEKPRQLKVLLQIMAEEDIKFALQKNLVDAFKKIEKIDLILVPEKKMDHAILIGCLEPHVGNPPQKIGNPPQKIGNVAAGVQYIDYFNDTVLKEHVYKEKWEEVQKLTRYMIKRTYMSIHLFSRREQEKPIKSIVDKALRLFLEKDK